MYWSEKMEGGREREMRRIFCSRDNVLHSCNLPLVLFLVIVLLHFSLFFSLTLYMCICMCIMYNRVDDNDTMTTTYGIKIRRTRQVRVTLYKHHTPYNIHYTQDDKIEIEKEEGGKEWGKFIQI